MVFLAVQISSSSLGTHLLNQSGTLSTIYHALIVDYNGLILRRLLVQASFEYRTAEQNSHLFGDCGLILIERLLHMHLHTNKLIDTTSMKLSHLACLAANMSSGAAVFSEIKVAVR